MEDSTTIEGSDRPSTPTIKLHSKVRIRNDACSEWEQNFAAMNDDPVGVVTRFFWAHGVRRASVKRIGSDSTYSKPVKDLELAEEENENGEDRPMDS